ncbi:hypothetical protein GZ102_06635, partial [Staphylococcus aureus]|nr:hypothetical protein [Staphylococcus aureus]
MDGLLVVFLFWIKGDKNMINWKIRMKQKSFWVAILSA